MRTSTKIHLALLLGLLIGLGSCAHSQQMHPPAPPQQTWPQVHCPPWDMTAPLASDLLAPIRTEAQNAGRADVVALVDTCTGPTHVPGPNHTDATGYSAWQNVNNAFWHTFKLGGPDWPKVIDELGHGP